VCSRHDALDAVERRGLSLFFDERAACFHCHSTALLTDHEFHNIGLDAEITPRNPMTHDRHHWEQLWAKTLREHADKVAQRAPSAYVVAETANLTPGRALDAGCGHGAEALWLAGHGWKVTAVDFAGSALAHARATADALGPQLATRVAWVEADLAAWTPPPGHFDLVVCLYVHIAGTASEMVRRMASGVAPGGTLLMVGHRPHDPATGKPTAAASQVQVDVDSARNALDRSAWTLICAEERPRAVAGTGVDAVIVARRHPTANGRSSYAVPL
jgi:SAM-dependent methyltransferase